MEEKGDYTTLAERMEARLSELKEGEEMLVKEIQRLQATLEQAIQQLNATRGAIGEFERALRPPDEKSQ